MAFQKAVKTRQYLRLAIDGISGSGKTYTALATAHGMAEALGKIEERKCKIALIDSEHGSASLYADRFDFDTLELMEFEIENYVDALREAEKAGYDFIIIDSTSHAWDALVQRVERIANQKFGGNSFRAWSEGTPLQKRLIEAMLTYPGHLIVTCRSKTEYSVDKDDKGKTTIKKVGTAAVQRQGFEYEFTMAMTMDANHFGGVTKDRTGKFQDKFIDKPGIEFGKQLIQWLNEGESPPVNPGREKTLQEKYNDTLAEIANILKSTDESGNPIFSDKDKDDAQKHIKENLSKMKEAEDKFKFISLLLEDLKRILHQRIETVQYEIVEPAQIEHQTEHEPFEDDIPDDPPNKKGKKTASGELGL